ncbi:DUF58 domain-containing protein [Tropicimonas sp. IMCC6043]|uniref:DUF58 domain-containing protein n=1 Tax=Tropicimonas sp. IMCC6043 TaxID=2510645 RepID=UPI00101BAFBD|nr:DUF58 domain-containing protein [Tropicimonas sp. IMCC6043]RYH08298.1 DUF58 domain-containing protein [Tropicimonas sp. IMCC6043]
MSQAGPQLRTRAEGLAAALPPLLVQAEHLASTVLLGAHGRRRAGTGDEFWQYRPLSEGDEARQIDWRRSAKSDVHFIRQREWQAAQSVVIWVDGSRSMGFSGDRSRPAKSDRARLLALALSVLLVRGGERVGLANIGTPPRSGQVQLLRLAEALSDELSAEDYGRPETPGLPLHARAVFLSDFLGDMDAVEAALAKAADRGVHGMLFQVLDPAEESFPFDGRTIFESMGGTLRHETLKAGELKERYLERLAERKDRLERLARLSGWLYTCHHTGDSAQTALLWLYTALERTR